MYPSPSSEKRDAEERVMRVWYTSAWCRTKEWKWGGASLEGSIQEPAAPCVLGAFDVTDDDEVREDDDEEREEEEEVFVELDALCKGVGHGRRLGEGRSGVGHDMGLELLWAEPAGRCSSSCMVMSSTEVAGSECDGVEGSTAVDGGEVELGRFTPFGQDELYGDLGTGFLRLDFSLLSPSLNLSKILLFRFPLERDGGELSIEPPGSGSCWSSERRAFLLVDDPDNKGNEEVEVVEARGVTRSPVGTPGDGGEEEFVAF